MEKIVMSLLLLLAILYAKAIYTAKQTIILVQANPKNQPGGVMGDLLSDKYHSAVTA